MAARNWSALVYAKDVSTEFEPLRRSAQNNLGFLYYQGWGVPRNSARAIELWNQAYSRGHAESTYHLCHAYADEDEPQYMPKKALAYCKEALRRYDAKKAEVEEVSAIPSQIRDIIRRLETRKSNVFSPAFWRELFSF